MSDSIPKESWKLKPAEEDIVLKSAEILMTHELLLKDIQSHPSKKFENYLTDKFSCQILMLFNSNVPKGYKRLANLVIRHRLEKVLNGSSKLNSRDIGSLSIVIEGSWACDLAMHNSSLDLVIKTRKKNLKPSKEDSILSDILEIIKTTQRQRSAKILKKKFMAPIDFHMSFLDVPVNINLGFGSDASSKATTLLSCYAQTDKRFVILTTVLKIWKSKVLDKVDKHAMVSGFALTLMLIQYLQAGCQPPVLPCYNQLYPEFFKLDSDLTQLKNRITEYHPTNTNNFGDLLLGFFEYYRVDESMGFDFLKQTVSVREGKPIKKKNPQLDPVIRIEDPFTLQNVVRYEDQPKNKIQDSIASKIERFNATKNILDCFAKSYVTLKNTRNIEKLLNMAD